MFGAEAVRLPPRPLRREPFDFEVRAAVDFAEMEVVYDRTHEGLMGLFHLSILPGMVAALQDQIVTTRRGNARQRLTAPVAAGIRAPVLGVDEIAGRLLDAARAGAQAASDEALAQGVDVPAASEAALARVTREQAEAVAVNIAQGVSLAAGRRASQVTRGRSPAEVADEVARYLFGLEHAWERDQLAGAVQAAQNAGRIETWDPLPDERVESFYASELLDAATCGPCREVDGTSYAELSVAQRAYPFGGFVDCRGGPRCRGTLVAILAGEL